MGLAAELDVRAPGHSAVGWGIRWFAATAAGAWLLSRTLRHLDRAVLLASGGRVTISDGLAGLPVLFLTTTGARTGRLRTSELIAVPAGEHLAVIGSNFGSARHPGWVHNLSANPRATASYRDRRVEVIARELTGVEADQVWAIARTLNPGFETYPRLAGDRVIRVFQLEPLSSTTAG